MYHDARTVVITQALPGGEVIEVLYDYFLFERADA